MMTYFNDAKVNFLQPSKTFSGNDQFRQLTTNTTNVSCTHFLPELKEELDTLSKMIDNSRFESNGGGLHLVEELYL